jgi:hypothetical protein
VEVQSAGLVTVKVDGPTARLVPVTHDVGQELKELSEMADGSRICGGGNVGKNYANSMSKSIRTRAGVQLTASRLRSTWIVEQIDGSLPLRELLYRSGLRLPGSLDDYIRFAGEATKEAAADG